MRYVQMARAPGRVRIILSRVLGGGLAAAAVRLIVFFLGQRDFFYLGIVGVVWLLVLAAAAVAGRTASFVSKKGLYFLLSVAEEHPAGGSIGLPLGKGAPESHFLGRMRNIVRTSGTEGKAPYPCPGTAQKRHKRGKSFVV